MFSVQRIREFFSTLRMRLVLWTALIVFLMDSGTNIIVREVEHRLLQQNYDGFLLKSLDDVNQLVANADPANPDQLDAELRSQVSANESRSWFLQIFDAKKRASFTSRNAPPLDAPAFVGEVNGPKNNGDYRIFEKRLQKPSGETYYVRCGFLQVALLDDIEILNRSLFLASLSTLLAVPLGAYLIALRATRPIAQIITTTAQLQPSNLNERLPIRGTNDEIDQLSQTINGMLDRLALFIDQNRDFVANAAHELRSPLAAIRTSVEVGLNQGRTPEEYALILTDVMEEITRLAGLVNRLLILAEGDAGRLGGRDQTTRLDKVIRESVDMFEPVAETKGVRLMIGDLAPALVPGDETSLRQIVRNLIDNAIKYNRDQGSVVVHLRLDANKRFAFLIVNDTGIGIQREDLPRLFERFYRADKARSREKEPTGYGLGLCICQTIVQALKGEITVASEKGKGSTFTVRLPLAEEATPSGDKNVALTTGNRG
jgi:two-component system, OmpR family, heavy metal sensor histidine kinase CusS